MPRAAAAMVENGARPACAGAVARLVRVLPPALAACALACACTKPATPALPTAVKNAAQETAPAPALSEASPSRASSIHGALPMSGGRREDAAVLFTPAPRPPVSEEDGIARARMTAAPPAAPAPTAADVRDLSAAAACAEYARARNPDERSRLISELDELPPSERVRALATLFAQEKNSSLLAQMLGSLGGIDGEESAVLPIVISAAQRTRPLAVRTAAAEALESFDALPAAREAWRIFLSDPSPALREEAANALDRLAPPSAGRLPAGLF